MIDYKFLKRNGLEPKKIQKNKSSTIIETNDKKKYVLKESGPFIGNIPFKIGRLICMYQEK